MKPMIFLISAVALGATGALFAQTNVEISPGTPEAPVTMEAAPLATPPAPPATETPVPSKKKSPNPGDQKGQISELNAAEGTLIVGEKTFKLAPHGRVEVDGALLSLSDLKVGDRVAVVFFEMTNGDNLATRVIKGNARRHSKKP